MMRAVCGGGGAVVAAWFLLASGTAVAQPRDLDSVAVKTLKVSGSVWMLEGAGGNIGVSAGKDGIVLIDDQFQALAPKIENALVPLSAEPVRFVLNTHWHGDHTGGNVVFGAKAPILAHENVRVRMADPEIAKARNVPPTPPAALPVITYQDGVSLYLNGEDIRVMHVGPAHTDGDSVVFFQQSRVVHLGDVFFNGMFPFVDLQSGGSVLGLIAAVEKLRPMLSVDMKLIPGHGALASVQQFDEYRAMLKDCVARVQKGMRAKKTLQQLQQAKVLAGYEKWSTEFVSSEAFIETIYKELSAAKPSGPKGGVRAK